MNGNSFIRQMPAIGSFTSFKNIASDSSILGFNKHFLKHEQKTEALGMHVTQSSLHSTNVYVRF